VYVIVENYIIVVLAMVTIHKGYFFIPGCLLYNLQVNILRNENLMITVC